MLIYIKTSPVSAAYHFAAEEYCMAHMGDKDTVLMFWQTDQCIMLGNNQIAEAEINLPYVAEQQIDIVRRPSGGGTIYTDRGTLLITIITPFFMHQDAKTRQYEMITQPLLATLNQLGVPAKIEGRNDILVQGRKISGIAQHLHNNKLCSHCSLLFDTDFTILEQVLTPDKDKMQLKGIASVSHRVTNLKPFLPALGSMSHFKTEFITRFLRCFAGVQTVAFEPADNRQIIAQAAAKYHQPTWTFGKKSPFNYHYSHRFEQGQVDLFLYIEHSVILQCKIRGDFLNIEPIEMLEQQLQGISYQPDRVSTVIEQTNLSGYLGGIPAEDFLHCFFAH